jgi:hypothetical protein
VTGDLAKGAPRSFAFGPFVLVPERQLLLKGGAPVRIGSRALDILTALVERPGELVNKRELMACGWPNTVVDESNLKVNMVALRRALGDGPGRGQIHRDGDRARLPFYRAGSDNRTRRRSKDLDRSDNGQPESANGNSARLRQDRCDRGHSARFK